MLLLQSRFKYNKLLYEQLKRNDHVALYAIGGSEEK